MAHRALVAYRRDAGRHVSFALHYAHDGVGLADAISPAAPFGGPADTADGTAVADRLGLSPADGYDCAARVDPAPLVRRADPGEVLAALDASVESLVVVEPTCEAVTYLVCSLTVGAAPGDRNDHLVLARPDDDPATLRAWFVETKSTVDSAVARGALTPRAGRAALRAGLERRATVHSTDDASFLRRD